MQRSMDMVAGDVLASVRELLSKYPDSTPTEKERKLWREQAEKRRRHDGIRPRKSRIFPEILSNKWQNRDLWEEIVHAAEVLSELIDKVDANDKTADYFCKKKAMDLAKKYVQYYADGNTDKDFLELLRNDILDYMWSELANV